MDTDKQEVLIVESIYQRSSGLKLSELLVVDMSLENNKRRNSRADIMFGDLSKLSD